MFKLLSLSATNFRSYKTLELNNIDTLGLTLIHGKNGSGKSSIRLLIQYILTDEFSERIPLDEIAFNGDKDCIMKGIFEDEVGNEIVITKYRNHVQHKNNTYVTVGKADLSKSDRRESQKVINQIFKLGENTLGTSTIFSQLSESFPQSKDATRKKILYDALDLHKYTAYSKQASKFIANYKGEIDALNSNIISVQSSIDTLMSLVGGKKISKIDRIETFKRARDILVLKRKELEGEKDSSLSLMKKKTKLEIELDLYALLSKTKSTQGGELETYKTTLEDSKLKMDLLLERREGLKVKITSFNTTYDGLKEEFFIADGEYNNVKRLIALADKAICPITGIPCKTIEGVDYVELKGEEDKLKVKIDGISSIKTDIERGLESDHKSLKQVENEISKLDKEDKEYLYTIKSIESSLSKCNTEEGEFRELYGIEITSNLTKQILEIDKQLEGFKNTQDILNRLNSKINYLNSLIKELEELDKLKGKVELNRTKLGRLNQELKDIENKINYYKFWEVGFGSQGIPNMKSERFLFDLQDETNRNLSVISNELYISIDSQTILKSEEIREKSSYNVLSRSSESVKTFWSRSGGERQRVTVANILAFNALLSKFNFIIFDEVLELSLDESGKDSIINLLKQKADNIDVILVISNDDTIKQKFDNAIAVKRTDGVSELIGGDSL